MCDSLWRPYRFVMFLITVTLWEGGVGLRMPRYASALPKGDFSLPCGKSSQLRRYSSNPSSYDEAFADAYMARGTCTNTSENIRRRQLILARSFNPIPRPEAWFRRAIGLSI